MASEMLERVAWPIACELMELTAEDRRRYTWDDINGDTTDRAMSAARAAIEAMREPTEEMLQPLSVAFEKEDVETYRTMIDSALSEA